jgi:tryptophan-rich sensory protein
MMRTVFGAPLPVLAGAVFWVVALGGLGVLATDLAHWYYALRKPSWQPPDFLFGPVWSTIFLLAGVALVLGWVSASATPSNRLALVVAYVVNGALNTTWSVLFFRLRRPDWALLEVGLLWLSIAAMIVILWPLSRVAALLVVPYLAWVSFATVLNRAIIRLNGPFGSA